MVELKGKNAIVTGASRGIGRCIATALAEQGITVCLAARSVSELKKVQAAIETCGGSACCIPSDMSDEAQIKKLVDKCVDKYGRLDIVINNAALGKFSSVLETTTEQWDRIMAINARGPFILCREAIPHLRKQSRAWIINISSVVGVKGYINQAAYGASKHALMGFSKTLARELHEQKTGIRVHAICPGGVDTDLVSSARPDLDRSDLIRPEAIADTILFLLRQEGNAVIDEIHIHRASASPWA